MSIIGGYVFRTIHFRSKFYKTLPAARSAAKQLGFTSVNFYAMYSSDLGGYCAKRVGYIEYGVWHAEPTNPYADTWLYNERARASYLGLSR